MAKVSGLGQYDDKDTIQNFRCSNGAKLNAICQSLGPTFSKFLFPWQNTQDVTTMTTIISFKKIKVGLCSLHAVCVSVYSPHVWTNLYVTWDVHHGTWAHLPPIGLCISLSFATKRYRGKEHGLEMVPVMSCGSKVTYFETRFENSTRCNEVQEYDQCRNSFITGLPTLRTPLSGRPISDRRRFGAPLLQLFWWVAVITNTDDSSLLVTLLLQYPMPWVRPQPSPKVMMIIIIIINVCPENVWGVDV